MPGNFLPSGAKVIVSHGNEQQQSRYRPISEPQYLPTRHLSEARIFTAEGDEEHSAAFVRDLVDKEIIRSTGASTTLYG